MKTFQVRVENLKGTKEKYEYDEAAGKMHLDFVFGNGLLWPYNYGEILNTLGGDGDKLDAIVLASVPLTIGEVIECRSVGMIELLDRGERDDKIICIPISDAGLANINDINDLDKSFLTEFDKFLMELAKQKNKVMQILAFCDKVRAEEEINKATI
jgi:inorganic pyrophosphatase